MNRGRTRRATLFSCGTVLLLLLIPVGLTAFTFYRLRRQERLGRALIAAVKANDTKAVISLLSQGADANVRDERRPVIPFWRLLYDQLRDRKPKPSHAPTPLLLALKWKDKQNPDGTVAFPPENVPLIRALIKHGADPNSEDNDGRPPLLFAIVDRKVATIHFLLAHRADAKKYEPYFHDPLVDAVISCRGHPDVLQDLLDHGTNVNQRNCIGETALFMASFVIDGAAVKLLLAHHADVTLKGSSGETPLAWAMKYPAGDFPQIARMLKQAGAKK